MLATVHSGQFKRDVRKAGKRGKDMSKLRALLLLLVDQRPLHERYRDHALKGEWSGWRDAHLEPDWLLLYRIVDGELHLARTGTHADLFDE